MISRLVEVVASTRFRYKPGMSYANEQIIRQPLLSENSDPLHVPSKPTMDCATILLSAQKYA
jgi:hypothetical protein